MRFLHRVAGPVLVAALAAGAVPVAALADDEQRRLPRRAPRSLAAADDLGWAVMRQRRSQARAERRTEVVVPVERSVPSDPVSDWLTHWGDVTARDLP